MTASSYAGSCDSSDTTLIQESARDPERFAVIYHRHAVEIHRYVARRLGSFAADDLLGETFLIAFRQRDRYVPAHGDARPWLYGIATNLIRRHWRDEVRQYRVLRRTGMHPVEEGHADSVASAVTAESVRRQLGKALSRLRSGDRDVLLLIAWEELTYEAVAEALNIPIGTVRSRLNRARRKLRHALEETSLDPSVAAKELSNG